MVLVCELSLHFAFITPANMLCRPECACGNQVINGGKPATAESQCSMACSGNAAQKCGAGGRMGIYATGEITYLDVPVPQKTNLPGKWEYKGCLA